MSGPRPPSAITRTPEQESRLQHLSTCSMAPFASGQRGQIVLCAVRHPEWAHTTLAQRLHWSGTTVKRWRQRGQTTDSVREVPRAGTRRTFPPLQRARVGALVCSAPRQYGNPWQRWSGEKLARVAIAQHLGERIAPSTIRTWLHHDKSKPWRYQSWQPSPDPRFVEKARPVLALSAQAPALQAQGELTVWVDAKTSSQVRQRVTPPKAAAPGEAAPGAARSKRRGALQLFCAWAVASGRTFAQTRLTKKFTDFKAFLGDVFQSSLCTGPSLKLPLSPTLLLRKRLHPLA